MSGSRTEYQLATETIKRSLKKQGIKYGGLAKLIGLSESGVKKILNARDGSFQRLVQISRQLGLSLQELLAGAEESISDLSYTKKQQAFLSSNPRALELYWRLVYERTPLPEAEKEMHLSKTESFSLLRQLDKLDLLSLMPGGKVRVPPVKKIRWVGDGPLLRKLYLEWSAKFVRAVATPENLPGQHFLIRYFKVSRRTHQDLVSEIKELESDFIRRAIQDMRTESPELVHLRWLIAVDDKSFLS